MTATKPQSQATANQSICQVATRPSVMWCALEVLVVVVDLLGRVTGRHRHRSIPPLRAPNRACSSPPRRSAAARARPPRGCGSAPPSTPDRKATRASASKDEERVEHPIGHRPLRLLVLGRVVGVGGGGRRQSGSEREPEDARGGASLLARNGRRDGLLRLGGKLVAAVASIGPGLVEHALVDRLDAGGGVFQRERRFQPGDGRCDRRGRGQGRRVSPPAGTGQPAGPSRTSRCARPAAGSSIQSSSSFGGLHTM